MKGTRTTHPWAIAFLLLAGPLIWTGCGGGAQKPAVAIQGTIVFTRGEKQQEKLYGGIYLLDAQGTRRLAGNGHITLACPVWSADGTKIAYITSESQLAVVNRDGSGGAYLTPKTSDPSLLPSSPEWLPDGNISVKVGGKLAVLRPDGSGVRVLTPHNPRLKGGFDGGYSWSPDGTQIVFDGSELSLDPEVFLFDPEGGESQPLLTPPRRFYAFDWSPDGKNIVAGNWSSGQEGTDDAQDDLFVFDANGEGLKALAQPGREENPAWSPDGKMIVYKSGGGLWVMNADGSGAQSLGIAGGQPDWTAP
jgi:Tol biopolymer transport system component